MPSLARAPAAPNSSFQSSIQPCAGRLRCPAGIEAAPLSLVGVFAPAPVPRAPFLSAHHHARRLTPRSAVVDCVSHILVHLLVHPRSLAGAAAFSSQRLCENACLIA